MLDGGCPVVTVVCGCGACGQSFETRVHPSRGGQRKFAPGCPVYAERVRQANNASSRQAYERMKRRSPRHCYCGCGKVLPPRVWYHPDCQDKKASAAGNRYSDRPRTRAPSGRCGLCENQSWRRHPEHGCLRCGQPYAPERIRKAEPRLGSALALAM